MLLSPRPSDHLIGSPKALGYNSTHNGSQNGIHLIHSPRAAWPVFIFKLKFYKFHLFSLFPFFPFLPSLLQFTTHLSQSPIAPAVSESTNPSISSHESPHVHPGTTGTVSSATTDGPFLTASCKPGPVPSSTRSPCRSSPDPFHAQSTKPSTTLPSATTPPNVQHWNAPPVFATTKPEHDGEPPTARPRRRPWILGKPTGHASSGSASCPSAPVCGSSAEPKPLPSPGTLWLLQNQPVHPRSAAGLWPTSRWSGVRSSHQWQPSRSVCAENYFFGKAPAASSCRQQQLFHPVCADQYFSRSLPRTATSQTRAAAHASHISTGAVDATAHATARGWPPGSSRQRATGCSELRTDHQRPFCETGSILQRWPDPSIHAPRKRQPPGNFPNQACASALDAVQFAVKRPNRSSVRAGHHPEPKVGVRRQHAQGRQQSSWKQHASSSDKPERHAPPREACCRPASGPATNQETEDACHCLFNPKACASPSSRTAFSSHQGRCNRFRRSRARSCENAC